MAGRTFAIGDIHGELGNLFRLLATLPDLDSDDTLVFLGDYIDRGPESAQVVDYVKSLTTAPAPRVIALRGNHEDAWLRVIDRGWNEFVLPPPNGCLAAMRSFTRGRYPEPGEEPRDDEHELLTTGQFFPEDVIAWFRSLPHWYEDEHAIYVHAGLPRGPNGFMHPSEVPVKAALLWLRDEDFFRNYRGKRVVFGHTRTEFLPPELSGYTPDDPKDLWAYENVIGIDTGSGNGGFLTALELPAGNVYESR